MIDIAKLRQRRRIEFSLAEVATVLGLQPGGEAVVTLTVHQDQPEGRAAQKTREEKVVLVRVDRDTLAAYDATPDELAAQIPIAQATAAQQVVPPRLPHQIPGNARLNLDVAAAAAKAPAASESETSAPAAQKEPAAGPQT